MRKAQFLSLVRRYPCPDGPRCWICSVERYLKRKRRREALQAVAAMEER